MLETLDADAVRRWCGGGLAALRAHQYEIDELNVYPVPDGDTGTNLVLTLTSAQHALQEAGAEEPGPAEGTPLGRVMRRMARGALLGARGNSGVIVSQILRGMADSWATVAAVRGGELTHALRSATEAAYAAVSRPVEGTVLTVLAAAADGASRITSDDLGTVARAAARSAADALARTPQQLPALARAGVVDAGGRGLVLLLDALVEALGPIDPARPLEAPPGGAPADSQAAAPARESDAPAAAHVTHADGRRRAEQGDGLGYEVQYLLDCDDEAAVDALRATLDQLGDSLVVIGTGDGTWNVHLHVAADGIGPAVEAGVGAGRPHRVSVTPLTSLRRAPARSLVTSRAAVVAATGDGLLALFEAEGATVVDPNPSIGELIDAILTTGAGYVVLLPNDANTHAAATAAAREAEASGVRVQVVPTRSPVQALAALAVRDPARAFADDVIAMAEAAGSCRYGEVCTAVRDALTVAGPCRAGDLLGLVDGEVHVIGADLQDVSRRLLDRMLGGGGELATLVLGVDAPAALEQTLRGHVTHAWPFVEVQCFAGGQPRYHLLVGVE